MKLAIIGTGYVGLITGVCLANVGHTVYCVDVNEEKINKLSAGIPTIYEANLEILLKSNIEDKHLFFTTSLKDIINDVDLIFVAVGTPENEDGSTDLRYINGTIQGIAEYTAKDVYVVLKSTVPVGTKQKAEKIFNEHRNKLGLFPVNIFISSNPEFLKEGTAIADFQNPDRIVIGTDDLESKNRLDRVYAFWSNNTKILHTNVATAQLIKYASNSFNACKISFINSIAEYASKVGADITEVADGMGLDDRIGRHFLNAGIGYGGSCFPKDVSSLKYEILKKTHSTNNLLDGIEEENSKAMWYPVCLISDIRKRSKKLPKFPNKINIAILGLSFKPNTDDIRHSPGVFIMKQLVANNIKLYDPVALENVKRYVQEANDIYNKDNIAYCDNLYDAVTDADIVMLCTEWKEFKDLSTDNLKKIKSLMRSDIFIDGRNVFDNKEMSKIFDYYCIGKPKI